MATNNQGQITDRLPITRGAIFGAIAYVVGYLITLLFILIEDVEDSLFEFAGWIYYNAQFVDIEGEGEGGFNFLTDEILGQDLWAEATIPAIGYHLVPVVVFIVLGFMLVKNVGVDETAEGAKAGATLAVGAVVLAIVGTFLFSEGGGSPDLVMGTLLAGIVYPALFGAIGGILATQ